MSSSANLSNNFYTYYKASSRSSSTAPKSKLSLPTWASWDWNERHPPRDIHSKWNEFNKVLTLLREYEIANRDEGAAVVLGLGLLLRECWRAVEVDDDDDDTPKFLQESLLTKKRADQVMKVIEEVTGRLPSPDTGEKRPKEKGRKARAGKKKHATRWYPTHALSPAPSASKPSRSKKGDSSLAGNSRSQRERKPSQKLRDLE